MIRHFAATAIAVCALCAAAGDAASILKPVSLPVSGGLPTGGPSVMQPGKPAAARPARPAVPPEFLEIEKLMQAKDYDGALVKLDQYLAGHPDDFKAIAIKAFIYFKYQNRKEAGFKVIDDAIAKYPKMFDLYAFKVEMLKRSGDKDLDGKILAIYKAAAENAKDDPLRMSNQGAELLAQKLGEIRIAPAMVLLRAAKANMAASPDAEKFNILTNLARGYFFCSRADLAAAEQSEAAKYAKSDTERTMSSQLSAFYNEAATMAKQLDHVER